MPWPPRLLLAGVRDAIDRVDDAIVLLVAARRRLVHVAIPLKRAAGVMSRDAAREQAVRRRAERLARRVALPDTTLDPLLALLIGEACRQQGIATDPGQGMPIANARTIEAMNPGFARTTPVAHRWLRLMPPPARFAPLLRLLPARAPMRLLEAAMARVLEAPLRDGALDFMRGRRLGIAVSDLGLHWVFTLEDGRLQATSAPAEATVGGSATDLLLLASRLEDADTLFFQRALALTGDTELGLTARNVLERLPWESVPLGLRIALNRAAQIASTARAAHRGLSRS